MTQIKVKRVYAAPASSPSDGYRVFVDRLWPRGESHESFQYDLWAKYLAPSDELRQWYHADPLNRWEEFSRRYKAELEASPESKAFRRDIEKYPVVTLLYGSRDTLHNNAVVLADFLNA